MSIPEPSVDYYEDYWSHGREIYSGGRQGYAANFIRWMRAELAGLPREGRVLEVGCGDASFTRHLAEHSAEVTALDLSAGQIARNIHRFPDIRFIQHDAATRLPFEDGQFDVVWCSEVLEHLFAPDFALREMHRVLAPAGRLLVTVPHHGTFKNVLIALFKWDEHFAPTGPHLRFFTRNTLTKIAAAAGFADIRVRTCGIGRPLRDRIVATNLLLSARKKKAG